MLQVFRDSAKGTVGKVIVSLIVVTFVFFGADSIMQITGNTSPATVNGEDVSELEFQRQLNRRQQELTSQFGGEMAAQLANSPYLREEVLNSLINQSLQAQISQNLKLEISESQVLDTLAAIPAFQVNGVFDKDIYLSTLSQNGFTHQTFISAEKAQTALNQMQTGLVNSAFIVSKNTSRNASLDAQKRNIAYRTFTAESFKANVELSADELLQYYNENSEMFLSEEEVQLNYIELELSAIAEKTVVSDSDLENAYQSYEASLRSEEEREISHILFSDGEDNSAEAIAALALITDGKDFADLAAELSDDPGSAEFGGSLGKLVPDVYVNEFYDAAMLLESAGEVSGLVETQFGIHLIRLDSLTQPSPKTLVEMSVQLTSEIQNRKARDEMLLLESQLADESFASDDISQVAEVFVADVNTTEWLNRSSSDELMAEPKFVETVFSDLVTQDGMISDVVRLANGNLIVAQKSAYHPEAVKPFEDVQSVIEETLTGEKSSVLMLAEVARVSENTAELDESWGQMHVVERNDSELPTEVIEKAFELPLLSGDLSVGSTQGDVTSFVVALVDTVEISPTEDHIKNAEGYLTQASGGSQYQILFNQIKSEAKIKIR